MSSSLLKHTRLVDEDEQNDNSADSIYNNGNILPLNLEQSGAFDSVELQTPEAERRRTEINNNNNNPENSYFGNTPFLKAIKEKTKERNERTIKKITEIQVILTFFV